MLNSKKTKKTKNDQVFIGKRVAKQRNAGENEIWIKFLDDALTKVLVRFKISKS